MAPSRNYPRNGLKLAAAFTVALILSVTFFLPPKAAVHGLKVSRNLENLQRIRRQALGSRPPGCENKCLKCRPCIATLVVPSHQKGVTHLKPTSRGDDDSSYYLLSWKCRCGNKLFQP